MSWRHEETEQFFPWSAESAGACPPTPQVGLFSEKGWVTACTLTHTPTSYFYTPLGQQSPTCFLPGLKKTNPKTIPTPLLSCGHRNNTWPRCASDIFTHRPNKERTLCARLSFSCRLCFPLKETSRNARELCTCALSSFVFTRNQEKTLLRHSGYNVTEFKSERRWFTSSCCTCQRPLSQSTVSNSHCEATASNAHAQKSSI